MVRRLQSPLDVLPELARAMEQRGLSAVLVGNAAVLLHGISVDTADLDFVFVDGEAPRRRLMEVAADTRCTVTRPYYHRGLRWRLTRARQQLTVDLVCALDGFSNVTGLMKRAARHRVGGATVVVASLDDVLRSKRAAGRGRERELLRRVEQDPR